MLLTRSPLTSEVQALHPFARLACIRHAASVRPEPGSNSHERFSWAWLLIKVCWLIYSSSHYFNCWNQMIPYTIFGLSSLFSFQRSISSPLWQLFNIITSLTGSQQFFKSYLKSYFLGCCYVVTQLLDITMFSWLKSTIFFKIFSSIFQQKQ